MLIRNWVLLTVKVQLNVTLSSVTYVCYFRYHFSSFTDQWFQTGSWSCGDPCSNSDCSHVWGNLQLYHSNDGHNTGSSVQSIAVDQQVNQTLYTATSYDLMDEFSEELVTISFCGPVPNRNSIAIELLIIKRADFMNQTSNTFKRELNMNDEFLHFRCASLYYNSQTMLGPFTFSR